MGRLIDADICLHKAWQNFYKQEEEHQKNIDGYDIMRDQFYEQSGFECCQQTIVDAPTVEAIPKVDVVDMLTELQLKIKEKSYYDTTIIGNYEDEVRGLVELDDVNDIIQEKISSLKGENNDDR